MLGISDNVVREYWKLCLLPTILGSAPQCFHVLDRIIKFIEKLDHNIRTLSCSNKIVENFLLLIFNLLKPDMFLTLNIKISASTGRLADNQTYKPLDLAGSKDCAL